MKNLYGLLLVIVFGLAPLHAGWLNITDLKTEFETVELGGERIVIHYNLDETGTTEASPAYVFVQFRRSAGEKWQLLDSVDLRGDGIGLINFPGKRRIVWWGTGAIAQEDVEKYEFRVRGMAMVRVPAGTFVMKSVPGRGYDTSGSARSTTELPLFYLAKFETTVGMYADFLNDTGGQGQGWNQRMVNAGRVGVLQSGEAPNHTYSVAEGRSEFPIAFVSWYDARSFLKWCGLKLPTEAEWKRGIAAVNTWTAIRPSLKSTRYPSGSIHGGTKPPRPATSTVVIIKEETMGSRGRLRWGPFRTSTDPMEPQTRPETSASGPRTGPPPPTTPTWTGTGSSGAVPGGRSRPPWTRSQAPHPYR